MSNPLAPIALSSNTMLLVDCFFLGSHVSPAFAFRCCSILASLHPSRLLRPQCPHFFTHDYQHCLNILLSSGCDGGVVLRLLASHLGEPGFIPGKITTRFLHMGIMPDNAAGLWVFSGISCSPALAFWCCSILTTFHPHWL
ncbi:hypothetical protein PR048_008639 [Dryococelus australis]|uniref:Uncharacterized protein n=1 Tax=Dryococelus australis TaxID=614101 RepID=A0ABQ9HXR5_9NEOP|nr:hypothetical protein PR048_008639 [Dryococelus australis]